MSMNCPLLLQRLVISDDPQLAAQLSCALSMPGHYLPVIEGPRMGRPDSGAEIARRNNAASRVKPDVIYLAGLPDKTIAEIASGFMSRHKSLLQRIATAEDLNRISGDQSGLPPVTWGHDRLGIGLLKALRAKTGIIFEDRPSPIESVPSKSEHLVVCEYGNELSQAIAANYAHALRAGLHLIPQVDQAVTDSLLEEFYSVYERQDVSQTEALTHLQERLRALCGPLPVPSNGSITFVTSGLPFGFAILEAPSTHLFRYPDLGTAIINGFAAEQPDTPGIQFGLLVDPETTEAQEIDAIETILGPRGAFLRTYYGPGANVSDVTRAIELFPYDLLVIATHCGDVSGYRWTYEFKDSEGYNREFVVDIALGVGQTPDPNMLAVTQFIRFISLDGVDWSDSVAKKNLHVGTAITDFFARTQNHELEPVKKENTDRVFGSAALKMHDANLILLPKPLADEGTPIVINNACVSWHRLANHFSFCNARAYIGTLFPVTGSEAHEVVVTLVRKYFTKPLPAALWSTQRNVYGTSTRRPYVITGVYTQWLRARRQDVIGHLVTRLSRALAGWQRVLAAEGQRDTSRHKIISEGIAFYRQELAHFQNLNARHPYPPTHLTPNRRGRR
jgi:hypothetical protein